MAKGDMVIQMVTATGNSAAAAATAYNTAVATLMAGNLWLKTTTRQGAIVGWPQLVAGGLSADTANPIVYTAWGQFSYQSSGN